MLPTAAPDGHRRVGADLAASDGGERALALPRPAWRPVPRAAPAPRVRALGPVQGREGDVEPREEALTGLTRASPTRFRHRESGSRRATRRCELAPWVTTARRAGACAPRAPSGTTPAPRRGVGHAACNRRQHGLPHSESSPSPPPALRRRRRALARYVAHHRSGAPTLARRSDDVPGRGAALPRRPRGGRRGRATHGSRYEHGRRAGGGARHAPGPASDRRGRSCDPYSPRGPPSDRGARGARARRARRRARYGPRAAGIAAVASTRWGRETAPGTNRPRQVISTRRRRAPTPRPPPSTRRRPEPSPPRRRRYRARGPARHRALARSLGAATSRRGTATSTTAAGAGRARVARKTPTRAPATLTGAGRSGTLGPDQARGSR